MDGMKSRSRRTWTIRAGVGLLLAGGLAASGFAVAQAAEGSNPGAARTMSSSGSSSTPAGAGASGVASAPKGPHLPTTPGGWFGHGTGFGGGVGRGGAVGTVKSISSGSFRLTTKQGATVAVDTTAATIYEEALSKVTASALRVGQQVAVLFTRPTAAPSSASPAAASSSTLTAASVEIILPSLEGGVVSISGGTIVVSDLEGFHRTIVTTGATTYAEAGTSVSASALTKGADIVAFGAIAANHTDLDATTVEIVGPVAGGTVTKVSGTTITLAALAGGHTLTIVTTPTTIFRSNGKASSLSAIKVGDVLAAIGTPESTTRFAATAVRFGSRSSMGAGGAPSGPGGWARYGGPGASGFGSGAFPGTAGAGGGRFGFGGFGGARRIGSTAPSPSTLS